MTGALVAIAFVGVFGLGIPTLLGLLARAEYRKEQDR